MASSINGIEFDISTHSSFGSNITPVSSFAVDLWHITPQNSSPQHRCIQQISTKNTSESIVSTHMEFWAYKIKNTLIAILFLIGGPGNVINMAVFYKQGLKDRVNMCLFALALADEINLIAVILFSGESLYLQYATGEKDGPFKAFLITNHFRTLFGFLYVSSILSAIIACERCYCVLRPLKCQTLMRPRTMAAIIIADFVLVLGLFFVVTGLRYTDACTYDPITGKTKTVFVLSEFHKRYREVFEVLYGAVIGVGLSLCVIVVVTVATVMTAIKLRQILTWRAGITLALSSKEIALTKMLITTSVLFIVCVLPMGVTRFMAFVFPEIDAAGQNRNLFMLCMWISQIFTFVNSSFNIVMYYVMGSRYRKTFWSLCGKQTDTECKTVLINNVPGNK